MAPSVARGCAPPVLASLATSPSREELAPLPGLRPAPLPPVCKKAGGFAGMT